MDSSILDLIKVHGLAAWRRKWYALAAAWGVCIIGWLVVDRIPYQYEVSARLHVDTDAVLVPLLRGLAVDTGTASQAELMQKTLLSRVNLQKLLAMSYPEIANGSELDRERLSQRLALAIHISSVGHNLFALTYRDSEPKIAYDVVKAALTIFLDNQADAARTDMDTAQRFLRQQIASYETQLSEAEKRRAEFRIRYFDILPGEANAPSRLQIAKDNLTRLRSDYADAQLRLQAVKAQLASIPQFLSVDGAVNVTSGGVVTTVSPAQQQLLDAERNLKVLQLRFTDKHPDVIAAKRLLGLLNGSQPSANPETTGRRISNPVYEQVRLQIVEREMNLASLQSKLGVAETDTERLERLARDAPGVDAEYARLDRDYTVLQRNYNELVTRLEQARIADAANATTDNKVRVVDPPQLPQVPVAPKRPLLITGVLGLGLAAAVGVIVLFAQFDRSFGNLFQLRRLGIPVLGSLSYVGSKLNWRHWTYTTGFAVATVLLFCVYGDLMMRAFGFGSVV